MVNYQQRRHRSIVTIISFPRVTSFDSSNFLFGLDSKVGFVPFSLRKYLKLSTNFKILLCFLGLFKVVGERKKKR